MRGKWLRLLEEREPLFRRNLVKDGRLKIFPDPYHQEPAVGLITWILREIDEILYGEINEGED